MFGLQFGLGLGARRAQATSEEPVTIFEAVPPLTLTDTGNVGTTFRIAVPITSAGQNQIRVTIKPGSTNDLTILGMGFGEMAGGYGNTQAPIIELLFGGVSGFVGATTEQVSDWTDISSMDLQVGDTVVVTFTVGGSGHSSLSYDGTQPEGVFTFYQSGTFWDVQNVNGMGFSDLPETNFGVVLIETRSGGEPIGGIPMSWDDSRFAGNTAGSGSTVANATYDNKDWNENPSYTSGDQCFLWEGDGTDVLTMSECRVDAREGPRIGAGSTPRATLNIDQCFINCVGKTGDHADGLQAYSPGGQALVNITNSCLRSYTDAEAVSKYGAGFIGSAGLFWADNFQGEVRMTNVLIHGGGRGMAIYADTGTTRISFENVFFVPSPDGWEFFDYDIRATGGTLIVDKWINVRAATIVDGVIVPGASLPSP